MPTVTMLLRVLHRAFDASLATLVTLAALRWSGIVDIPDALLRWTLLLTTLLYLPVLASSVRAGRVSLPPFEFLRAEKPIRFWFATAFQLTVFCALAWGLVTHWA